MGKRCMSGGCQRTAADGVGLHFWPVDASLARVWDQFMKLKRKDWVAGVPKKSVICSAHFDEKWMDPTPQRKLDLGLQVRYRYLLLPGAIPTKAALQVPSTPTPSSEHADPVPPPAPKKERGAFAKRQHQRVLAELFVDQQMGMQPLDPVDNEKTEEAACDQECVTPNMFPPQEVKTSSHSVGIQAQLSVPRPPRRSKETQTPQPRLYLGPPKPKLLDASTQTEVLEEQVEELACESEEESEYIDDDDSPDYDPRMDVDDMDDEEGPEEDVREALDPTRRYIVSSECLRHLLGMVPCPSCRVPDYVWRLIEAGTAVIAEAKCSGCDEKLTWKSQPKLGKMFAGNVLLSASILFSGCRASKVLKMMEHFNLAAICKRTYFRHQAEILLPCVGQEWHDEQQVLFAALREKGEKCVIGGDGRADTPGHCAKFGTYTIMELKENLILDVQLVQSNECGGSYHMELEGLKRSVKYLEENGLEFEQFITDRHLSIAKWIRENMKVTHFNDIWHCAKGNSKRWEAAAKLKSCAELGPWIRSITNHMYWCAVTTPGDDAASRAMKVDKWKSVANHIMDIHTGHGDSFPSCAHGNLTGPDHDKEWIRPHTTAAAKVEQLVNNKYLLKDIQKLSPKYQTSTLEAYHSLVNQFAPKMTVFHFHAMIGRVLLAAMHYNENANRGTKVGKDGKEQFSVHYPKYRKGEAIIRKLKIEPTYCYVSRLIDRVEALTEQQKKDRPTLEKAPATLSSSIAKANKAALINRQKTRFCPYD